jgi:SnoaL-like domain
MNNDVKAVWERYVSSWNAASEAERRALFAGALAPDCVYRDPQTEARGWDELAGWMAGFHAQMPGTRFVMETFSTHHRRSVARWRMQSAAGLALGSGISYGEYDEEQRLLAMTVFFDDPEPRERA